MFNRFLIFSFIALMILGLNAFADTSLVYPLEKTMPSGSKVDFGSISPGETLELTISNATGYGTDFVWDQAAVDSEAFPVGWASEDSKPYGPTHTVKIIIGKDTAEGSYSFKVTMANLARNIRDESFEGSVIVRKDLHKASFSELSKETLVNVPVFFELTLINDSISDHLFLFSSNLPNDWMQSENILVSKKSVVTKLIEVKPLVYGYKRFKFFIDSKLTGKNLASFDAMITANPTLKNKFDVGLYGFPFFTPSIALNYFVNALISFFI